MDKRRMEMDGLEKFIADQRGQFDEEKPSAKVWEGIVDELEVPQAKVRKISPNWLRAIAAVGLLLLGAGIGAFAVVQNLENRDTYAESAGLGELEDYYYQEVNQMVLQLASNPDFRSIQEELSRIDGDISELKRELKLVPVQSKEQVLQSIISAYDNKVQMLERVMEHSKPFEQRTHEAPVNM